MEAIFVKFINTLAFILWAALIGRVIMSWINPRPSNPLYPIASLIYQITEPILGPIRRVLPPLGMFDLSVLVAFLLLWIIPKLLIAVVT